MICWAWSPIGHEPEIQSVGQKAHFSLFLAPKKHVLFLKSLANGRSKWLFFWDTPYGKIHEENPQGILYGKIPGKKFIAEITKEFYMGKYMV